MKFRRMTASERGRLSARPSLFPIKEIITFDDHIELHKRRKTYSIRWDQIQEVIIENRKGHAGYVFSEPIIRTLKIKTKNNLFCFDVSTNFPDFAKSGELVKEIKRHIVVNEGKVNNGIDVAWWLLLVSVGTIVIVFYYLTH